jgi:hypothetical protein
MIADYNYGGRIVDMWDRNLNMTLAKSIFNEKIITEEIWMP